VAEKQKYQVRSAGLIVLPIGELIFSEMATKITIDDEGSGEFVVISQEGREKNTIAVTAEEWPAIVEAVNTLLNEIKQAAPPTPDRALPHPTELPPAQSGIPDAGCTQ
jgi:hypothetical protein